jgi:adenylate cyclase
MVWPAVGAAVVVVLAIGWWIGRGGRGEINDRPVKSTVATRTQAETDTQSVAVLPFENMSADPENEYFTDGLTEELIIALAKVEGLQIPARTTAFALKGSDLGVQEIGNRLGVDNVLEGSVRKAGNRIRISAQLVKVSDGFNLWSETYDRELEDVFVIQDEIANSIAEALQITLSARDRNALRAGQSADIHAYDFYLRGRGYFRRRTEADLDAAREMFSKAIDIDSGFAPAWAGLADCYTEYYRNYDSSDDNLEAADRASLMAVDLDPDLAEAHAARGFALGQRRQYEAAENEFRRAVELDDTLFETYYYYGTVAFTKGELETAAQMFERALQVAPDDERAMRLLPQIYRSLGRDSEERLANRRRLELAEKRLELNPDDIQTVLDGAHALAALGEKERSLEWAGRILEANTDDALLLYNLACFFSVAGEVGPALDALEKSYREGLSDPAWMRQDADLDNLREIPRYKALVARMEAEN